MSGVQYKAKVYSEQVDEGPNIGHRYWVVDFIDTTRPRGIQISRSSVFGTWRDALRLAITITNSV